MWDVLMDYAPTNTGAFGNRLRWGETFGWSTLLLGAAGSVKGVSTVIGAITPDVVNGWLIFAASAIAGGIGVGILAYARILGARLDGETREAISEANIAAIRAGKPIPYPQFMPKGYAGPTANTVVDAAPVVKLPMEPQP